MGTPSSSSRSRRKFRNWFLQPILQIRLGLYSIGLSFLFSAVILLVLYVNLSDFMDIVIALTDAESEVRELFASYMSQTQWWVVGCVGLYLFATIMLSIVFTHRLVGPTIAFRSHIRRLCDGDFSERVFLRQGDAFKEVASDLNRLAALLEKSSGSIEKRP